MPVVLRALRKSHQVLLGRLIEQLEDERAINRRSFNPLNLWLAI